MHEPKWLVICKYYSSIKACIIRDITGVAGGRVLETDRILRYDVDFAGQADGTAAANIPAVDGNSSVSHSMKAPQQACVDATRPKRISGKTATPVTTAITFCNFQTSCTACVGRGFVECSLRPSDDFLRKKVSKSINCSQICRLDALVIPAVFG